jgi:hypothetical protein
MTLWFCPIVHPAAIMRGQWHKEPAQLVAMERVAHALKSGGPTSFDPSAPPPRSVLFPSLKNLAEFYESTKAEGWDALSHDLENAGPHIICDGMTQLKLDTGEVGRSLCLRFRRQGGGLYWTDWQSHLAAVTWLWWVLADPGVAKVFHNGVTHDVPILEELGFTVNGRLIDTLILAHTAYSEMPKSLQFCATFWNGSPVWKSLVDEADEEEGKG